ncbi:MAG: hypothetical protein NTZ28_00880 [Nitrospirae bacterium]|nr:hypothetical protein [Nitrospirota bacterium]
MRRGTLLHLHGTGLPILQETMLAAGILKHRLAATSEQEQQPRNEWPLSHRETTPHNFLPQPGPK